MTRRRSTLAWAALAVVVTVLPLSGAPDPGAVRTDDLRDWLSYIASDELQGRAVFSAGLGLAAGYISDHLKSWGVKPGGDGGSYLQTVRVLSVKATNRSTVTVQIGDDSRTFADGEALVFQRDIGAKRRLSVERVEFAGYGLELPAANQRDLSEKDLKGAAVVWLGESGPKSVDAQKYRLLLSQRSRDIVDRVQPAAVIGPELPLTGRRRANAAGNGPLGAAVPDFTTVERLDKTPPPRVQAKEAFFEYLFSRAPIHYEELKRRVSAREPIAPFRLDAVKLVFDVDVDYQVVRTQLTHNIVGSVEGSDPVLKETFVAFGAHYDHVGYADGDLATSESGRPARLPGRVTSGSGDDRIWNGADDDGSGTVGLMGIARAFALGARPKRSLLFVWHTGEEAGRYGSLYFADNPSVRIDRIVTQLNVDMIGRNRDNKASEANTLYLVGSDRISSELDTVTRAANHELSHPFTLDYEFNDPSDSESLYTRSDHYSYASKGVPVIFFTTGLHPDYHANTDEVSRIQFDKMTRVVEFIYQTGMRLANLDHPPVHDNRGARAGRGSSSN
jgi:peptidase M28-like protein